MTARAARALARKLQAAGLLVVETYTGSGPGGQHRNRTQSGVRLVYRNKLNGEAFELRAQACLKSQHESMRYAMKTMLAKFRKHLSAVNPPQRGATSGFGAGNRVRSYHQVDDRVNDTSGFVATWRATVGKADIGPLIDERRERLLAAQPLPGSDPWKT